MSKLPEDAPIPTDQELIPADRYLAFWAWCRAWNARPQKKAKQHRPVNPYTVVRPEVEPEREWTTADHVAEAQRLEQERREEGMEDA